MCFSTPTPPPPPKPLPVPNKADDANQQAVQSALRKAKGQNASAQTTVAGNLGDSGYGQNVQKVNLLGQSGQ